MKGKDKGKEDKSEEVCFDCKDGGDLLICEHKDCLKCFHPSCVKKDDSILGSEEKYVCDRHACYKCSKSSIYRHYCYTCIKSVCLYCLPTVEFYQIKGKYGFCNFCIDVVMLIEEYKDYDSDDGKVDFSDEESKEYFFMQYYHRIKDKEGFETKDIHAAIDRAKRRKEKRRKENQSASVLEDYEEEEDEEVEDDPDFAGTEDESICESLHEGKSSKRKKSAVKSNKKQKTHHGSTSVEPPTDQPKENNLAGEESEKMCSNETQNNQTPSNVNVIDLLDSDDENENGGKFDDVESCRWSIRGPFNDKRYELSLSLLRKWAEMNSFASNFKVWRDDENEENAIWLPDALSMAFLQKSKEDM